MNFIPQARIVSQSEWTSYPNYGQPVTYHAGKRCFIDKMHPGTKRCTTEQTLEAATGRKKKVEHGWSVGSGSRTFLKPEYSSNFYKLGSTLPKANFGYPPVPKADTFIPLQPVSEKLCMSYEEKKEILEREEDILKVKDLGEWKPTPPLFESLLEEQILLSD
ncbi:hypothetical protein NFI96_033186 [Prochilodus magdalenae]|nr:hypothetical protein NFI96_033186 [Prochilodus magdalenae]